MLKIDGITSHLLVHLSAIGGMLQIDVPISHNRTSRGC